MEETLLKIASTINTYLSNYLLVAMLLGVGIWYTVKTKFIQVRCFKEGWNRVFGNLSLNGGKQESGMSSFQALATAIAAQVGTGNIVGSAGAIMIGGPGAIFWMWLIAFFGMATIYAEATLALKTRTKDPETGEIQGGPVYYITKAFPGGLGKFLAAFFAICITLALGFMGSMAQANSIGESMHAAFGIPTWVVGAVLVVLCGFIFIGGTQRLASVVEKLIPIMAAIFLLGGVLVLIIRIKFVPAAFGMIFKYAFKPEAILGGGFGAAIVAAVSQGAKRGLFSNEAGMGSTPHAHAQANVAHPHEQGTVAMMGVFLDTFVVLTLNALVIISCLYSEGGLLAETGVACGAAGALPVGVGGQILSKTNLAQNAFAVAFGQKIGPAFVAICLLFFAFSTILGWNLFGKINMNYLFGKVGTKIYTLIALVLIFVGTMVGNDVIWEWTDVFNNLMVIPNVLALFALTKMVTTSVKEKNLL